MKKREKKLEEACKAVLLFFDSSPWSKSNEKDWKALTGREDCNTKNLCDFVREVLEDDRRGDVQPPKKKNHTT